MASRAEWIEAVARALLEAVEAMRVPQTLVDAALQVATFSPLVSSLRAALALPADAAGSAEAVRAACAAVPALEEAMRRRLRWADEVHSQILAVPVPAQPAPAQAGEAVCVCGHSSSQHLHGGSDGTGCDGLEPCPCQGFEPHPSRPGGA